MKQIYIIALVITLSSCNDTDPEIPRRLLQPTEKTMPVSNSVLISVVLVFGAAVAGLSILNKKMIRKGLIASK